MRMNSNEFYMNSMGRKGLPSVWVYEPLEWKSVSLKDCLAYTHIRSKFHSICYNTNLYNFLTCQNYSELGKILGKIFEHMNKILK